MALWQLDIVGGVFLADGREVKIVTGVDDHSRYCVIAHATLRATGRAGCLAFARALQRYGVPEEVLTDNGRQFTARFGRGGEVLFDRIWRDNGIVHRLTHSPFDRRPDEGVERRRNGGRTSPRSLTGSVVDAPSISVVMHATGSQRHAGVGRRPRAVAS